VGSCGGRGHWEKTVVQNWGARELVLSWLTAATQQLMMWHQVEGLGGGEGQGAMRAGRRLMYSSQNLVRGWEGCAGEG